MMDTTPGNALERLAKRLGFGFYASHIGPEGSYMRRFIFRHPFGTVRLHNILRSDEDRHLHDHPFDFTSFLLSGGYTETTPCDPCRGTGGVGQLEDGLPERCDVCRGFGRRYINWPRFSIVRKKAQDLHCLALGGPVWTLVFAARSAASGAFRPKKAGSTTRSTQVAGLSG
jgi:hypothetical protein